ncbi:ribonuclease HII [Pseudoxanthomonas broegbernensis]|uniref:Ribonuclease HII n=2 Tax=Pseudoxanthomonas broegbernensis TaxID=83619 RepID=A0A7V8GMM2_9GAMM|nr:ribonuclease HII [Pseudoxanthomonas broegbernensis]KAF1686491.1 ribonuclease HII [Pseudoxanthomonas broegbernensis]
MGMFAIDRSSLRLAGVDEAGRGPLAGPVAVAAVILDPARPVEGLNDSKKLSHARREALYPLIVERAAAWHVEMMAVAEIDRLNILHATLEGMRRCVVALGPQVELVRIDGNAVPKALPCMAEALVGGDALEPAIMAASILAKVARDRLMCRLHAEHPQYGFDLHKGYPTPAHLAALSLHGPCPHHRRSFAPVRESAARMREREPAFEA